jgi:hypothetical protein
MSNRSLEQFRRNVDAHIAALDNSRKAAPLTWQLYEELLAMPLNLPADKRREYETVLHSLGEAASRGYALAEGDVVRVRALIASLWNKAEAQAEQRRNTLYAEEE